MGVYAVLICHRCGERFERLASSVKKSNKAHYCSRVCTGQATTIEEKFLARMGGRIEGLQGCVIWPGGKNASGYGMIHYRREYKQVHRVSYLAHKGAIPPGLNVLHKCDTRPCVNPEHLYTGTQRDNVFDAVERGRWHTKATLSRKDVREIRRLRMEFKLSQKALAKMFGVTPSCIQSLLAGRTHSTVMSNPR